MSTPNREQGLEEELAFWQSVMSTGGGWPQEWKAGFDPELPLQEELRDLVTKANNDTPKAEVFILDVGAGPVTTVGRTWPGHEVFITPIDPLADKYNQSLRERGFHPPVPTQRCAGEVIERRMPRDFYDLAYSRNALDHSEDPVSIISQMLGAVKPGGYVYLEHSVREASKQGYKGLHQWNFFEDGAFYVEGSSSIVNVFLKFEDRTCYEEVRTVIIDGRDWVKVVMRRRP